MHGDGDAKDLSALREITSRALLAVLWLHVPIAMTIGMARGTDWLLPTLLNAGLAGAATLSWRAAGSGLSTCLVVAVALMGGVSVFTFELSGHPWQIDMHMYFFAALACLVAYCDFRPIVAGTLAVALHHLVLNFIIPAGVFPGGADFGRVVLHAVILVLEAGVLVWVARQLAQMFVTQRTAETEAANAALARANADRVEAEHQAKRERDAAMLGLRPSSSVRSAISSMP
jgi:methyl-accepting chemotaxis protein